MNRIHRSWVLGPLLAIAALAAAQQTTPTDGAAATPAATETAPAAGAAAAPTEGATPVVPAPPPPATQTVVLNTALGEIHIAVEIERAPITAANFLRYVDNKRFDGMSFYRAHKISEDGKYAIVQGGLQNDPKKLFRPIAHESPLDTGLSHLDGAISMARSDPGTATADFFIVVGDLVSMDGKPDRSDLGYAVFGRVTSGMDVVRAILEFPRTQEARNPVMKGQMLATPVKVISARRAP